MILWLQMHKKSSDMRMGEKSFSIELDLNPMLPTPVWFGENHIETCSVIKG